MEPTPDSDCEERAHYVRKHVVCVPVAAVVEEALYHFAADAEEERAGEEREVEDSFAGGVEDEEEGEGEGEEEEEVQGFVRLRGDVWSDLGGGRGEGGVWEEAGGRGQGEEEEECD